MRLLAVHPGASYSTADVFSGIVRALEAKGVEVPTYDLESRLDLSERWTNYVWRRKGKPLPKYNAADVVYWASKDIIERALHWNADGVLIISGMFLHPRMLVLLRRAHIRTALVCTESPYDDAEQERVLPLVDLAWTHERSSVTRLRRANPNVGYLPHAYDPETHHEDTSDLEVKAHDVVFVGSMFAERADFLSKVDWSGIDFGLYGAWRGLPSRSKLRQHLAGNIVDNRTTAQLYRKAKIGLNLYRESMGWGRDAPRIDHAESMNPRALELAACGCFQISSYRDEVAEVFGSSVPTFQTPSELEALIREYLARPLMREVKVMEARTAAQGHTFAERADRILADVERVWHGQASTPRLEVVLA